MMGSPASTAAYLIHSSRWDDEAEEYLRSLTIAGNGKVASAFPVSVLEIFWVRKLVSL